MDLKVLDLNLNETSLCLKYRSTERRGL